MIKVYLAAILAIATVVAVYVDHPSAEYLAIALAGFVGYGVATRQADGNLADRVTKELASRQEDDR